MLLVGITGATLVGMGVLQNRGFEINEQMIQLVIKLIGFGSIFWLFKIVSGIFLFW